MKRLLMGLIMLLGTISPAEIEVPTFTKLVMTLMLREGHPEHGDCHASHKKVHTKGGH